MDLIKAHLPKTYYADRDSEERIKLFVEHWQRLVKVNQELQEKVDNSRVDAEVKVLKPTCSNCKHLGKYTDCDICNNKDLRLWNLSNCDINIEEWGCTYFEERKA